MSCSKLGLSFVNLVCLFRPIPRSCSASLSSIDAVLVCTVRNTTRRNQPEILLVGGAPYWPGTSASILEQYEYPVLMRVQTEEGTKYEILSVIQHKYVLHRYAVLVSHNLISHPTDPNHFGNENGKSYLIGIFKIK